VRDSARQERRRVGEQRPRPQEASLQRSSPANGTIRLAAAKSAKRPASRSETVPRNERQRPTSTSGAKRRRPLFSDRRKPWTWTSQSNGDDAQAMVWRSSVHARAAKRTTSSELVA
jgi:hypothetical protein